MCVVAFSENAPCPKQANTTPATIQNAKGINFTAVIALFCTSPKRLDNPEAIKNQAEIPKAISAEIHHVVCHPKASWNWMTT